MKGEVKKNLEDILEFIKGSSEKLTKARTRRKSNEGKKKGEEGFLPPPLLVLRERFY